MSDLDLDSDTAVAFALRMDAERNLLHLAAYVVRIRQKTEFARHTYSCVPDLLRRSAASEMRKLADLLDGGAK